MTKEETEVIFEKLYALQDVLSKKNTLEWEITEIPKMLSTQKELLTRLKKQWIERDQEYVSAKAEEGELRNLLFEAQSNKEKAEKNMELTNTQREYENLDREIKESLEREQQYHRDLKLVEQRITELNAQMQQNKDLMDQQDVELNEKRKRVDSDIESKTKELELLDIKAKEITNGMDQELLFKFERIIKKKGGRGIVTIKGGVCSSCHMILPAQFANDVKSGNEIVSCPYCSSVLCYEESVDGDDMFFENDTAGSLSDLDDLDDEEFEEEEEIEEEDLNIDYDE
ncbi:MAG: C4-type zinc ribbon domain-containing protein [Termitinemataceae bacterium]|nr:MAG: C4-type zinc ribbon domain-containing protein [Termitinemataceae bacterium]